MRDDRIEHLIRLVEKSQITELEIQEGWGRSIRISKGGTAGSPSALSPPNSAPAPVTQSSADAPPGAAEPVESEDSNLIKVVAPMVGTFYRSSSPDNPPFVEVGTRVESGQTLCIIEAMKIMNEIAAELSGNVRKVLVENGQPVEFGQTLFLIDKSS